MVIQYLPVLRYAVSIHCREPWYWDKSWWSTASANRPEKCTRTALKYHNETCLFHVGHVGVGTLPTSEVLDKNKMLDRYVRPNNLFLIQWDYNDLRVGLTDTSAQSYSLTSPLPLPFGTPGALPAPLPLPWAYPPVVRRELFRQHQQQVTSRRYVVGSPQNEVKYIVCDKW